MEALYHLGDLKICEIIEKTLSTSGNMTVVIRNLEKESYITRYQSIEVLMNIYRSDNLGKGDHGWLKSNFHYSFANYYNPKRMGFGDLRVFNDDRVQPGTGFDTHPHKNMEIVSYVIEGELSHKDSMGSEETLYPGEVQYMSAGTGVYHSEYNHGDRGAYGPQNPAWKELESLAGEDVTKGAMSAAAFLYGSSEERKIKFAESNAGLLAMSIMYSAKTFGVDSHPMSGVDFDGIKDKFNLRENEDVVMVIGLGYNDQSHPL